MTARETELHARLFPDTAGTRETLTSLGTADAAAALFDDADAEAELTTRCVSLTSLPGMLVVRYAAAGVAHRRHDHGPLPPCRKYVYRVGARADGVHALTLMETFDGDEYTRWNLVEDVVRACIFFAVVIAVIGGVGFLAGYATGTGAATRIVSMLFRCVRITFVAVFTEIRWILENGVPALAGIAWYLMTDPIGALDQLSTIAARFDTVYMGFLYRRILASLACD